MSEEENALGLNQVPIQLQSAQQEINNLRLLNVCLQSTLFRVQSQLIEFLPENLPDESKRNETKRKLASLRPTDDHVRRKVLNQQVSFLQAFDHLKSLFEPKQQKPVHEEIRLEKHQKQIEVLHEMFHELNTMIHTEHHDRIYQLYLTLAQTSHSVFQAREVLDQTVQVHRRITRKRLQRQCTIVFVVVTCLSTLIFIIVLSIRLR